MSGTEMTEVAEFLIEQRPNSGELFMVLLHWAYDEMREAGIEHEVAYAEVEQIGDEVLAEVERLTAPYRRVH